MDWSGLSWTFPTDLLLEHLAWAWAYVWPFVVIVGGIGLMLFLTGGLIMVILQAFVYVWRS